MSEQSAAWEYKEESPLREAWKMYLQNRAAVLGLVLLGAVLLLTCVGPLVYPVDPFEMVAPPMSAPGEYGLICGSDYLGRDIFAGIIAGGKATMAVGGFATLVTLCIGITIGALAGYRQGIWDELLMRATEFFQVLPPLLLAMVVVALFSPSLTSVAVSIGIVSWPQVARVTRAEFMRIKEMDYVAAARTMGAGNATIMCRVILPNAIPPLVIVATLTISSAILFESGLSFLGLCELSRKLRISVTIVENGPMPIFLFGMFFALRISPPEQGSAKRRGACQSRHNPRLFFRYFSASSRAVNRLRLMS